MISACLFLGSLLLSGTAFKMRAFSYAVTLSLLEARKMRKTLMVIVALALASVAKPASADPISSCVTNVSGGQTCNIYESDANGNPTDTSSVVSTEAFQSTGYVVLLDNTNDNTNPANWSDLAVFTQSTIQLYSDGTWTPALATAALAATNTQFILEAATAPTFYTPDQNLDQYFFYSPGTPVTPAPEPGTMTLFGSGLIAFVGLAMWKKDSLASLAS